MRRGSQPAPEVRAAAGDGSRRWHGLAGLRGVVEARCLDDVLPALAEVERQTGQGRIAAGFIAYEAAPAFDPALGTRPPGPLPLAWFALFDRRAPVAAPEPPPGPLRTPRWRPCLGPGEYRAAFDGIKARIAAGETYQVNYTYRLRAPWRGDERALFAALVREQGSRYGVHLAAGGFSVLSASPELFFRLEGERVSCRPMKGTAARGATAAEDRRAAAALRSSEKERAENVMIVDMVRNDLGRIARTGSVEVPRLFTLERYPRVWQMTSTVRALTAAPLGELLRALFPSASITGAPKVRTSAIIAGLESTPRGAYCGAAGVLGPGRRGWMNVAIRTVTLLRGRAEYGTGSGVVWDSEPGAEAVECRAKTLLLGAWPPPFELLESLARVPGRGLLLLGRHLARLRESARHFGFRLEMRGVRRRLREAVRNLPQRAHKVRLLVAEDGAVRVEAEPLVPGRVRLTPRPGAAARSARPLRIALAASPVDRADRFLHHKTTHRAVYERARALRPGCDEVLLWNAEGELTEGTTANLVLRIDGKLLTPPVSSGLLPGTFRAFLLERRAVRERILRVEDLGRAEEVWLVSSVRGWRRCRVVGSAVAG